MRFMTKANEYVFGLLEKDKSASEAERVSIPIVLNDHADTHAAAPSWGIIILAAAAVEWYFGYDFFRDTLRLGLVVALLLPIAAVLTLCAGFKLLLEHCYAGVQNANVALREFLTSTDRANIVLRNDFETARKFKRQAHLKMRLVLSIVGGAIFAAGVIMLSLERVRLRDSDEISLLTYGYNVAFTVGGAILGTCAWHYMSKRNSEVRRIVAINEHLKTIEVDLIRLHELDDQGERNTYPDSGVKASAVVLNRGKNVSENASITTNSLVQ